MQRLLVFAGLCVVFGAAVWASDIGNSNPRALLADVNATGGAPTTNTSTGKAPTLTNAADEENKECPNENYGIGYNPSKKYLETYCTSPTSQEKPTVPQQPAVLPPTQVGAAVIAATICPSGETLKINAFGRPCVYVQKPTGFTVDAKCDRPGFCRAYSFTGQDGKTHSVVNEGTLVAGSGGARQGRGVDLTDPIGTLPGYTSGPYPTGPAGGQVVPTQPVPPVASGPSAPTTPSAGVQVGQIANSGNPAGGASGGFSNVSRSTFTPSPQLSNNLFSLGSLFGGGSPSIDSGQGGYSGGSIAYAPPSGPVGFFNRNFESLGSQTTFAPPQQTPFNIIANLAANTPRGARVTPAELAGRGVVSGIGDTLRAVGTALFSPVAELFNATFFPSPESDGLASSAKNQGGAMRETLTFDQRLLKLGVSELLLVPGDPREVFDRIAEIAESGPIEPSNPFLEGVLVRTDPWEPITAGDLLSGLFAFNPGADAADEGASALPGQDEGAHGEGMQSAIQGALNASKPKSAFSAMRLTLWTITSALANLFKNIFALLFWWL